METESVSAVSPGVLAATGSWLVANGSSWPVLIFALLGAFVAVLTLDPWSPRRACAVVIFNVILGAFGVPALLILLSRHPEYGFDIQALPAAIVLVLTFLTGWTAHHVTLSLREPFIKAVASLLGVITKKAGGG